MQTTLLGIAIAIIVALVAALAGPHFVDWDQYRSDFETQASRLTGVQVHIAGPIEARLLPTPALTLQDVAVARPGDSSPLRARSLVLEFALGALMRGEWRASEARLEGAEITVGIDQEGRLDWPLRSLAIPEAVAIEQLEVNDGRIILADAATGSQFTLENFEFKGEVRSLVGPAKGEGSFVAAGQNYPYKIAAAASRVGDDGGVRLHLDLDPADQPLAADIDALVVFEHGKPRLDGNVRLRRPVGHAPDGIVEPWRVTARIKANRSAALFDQIEFQYGSDNRAIKLRGTADLALGNTPELAIRLRAMQVDLDRVLALPEGGRRRPLDAVKALAESATGIRQLPIPVRVGISIENALLAGAALQRLNGEFKRGAHSWQVESLEFRAPGATQVSLSGSFDNGSKELLFSGGVEVKTEDNRTLIGWLTDRSDAPLPAYGRLYARGDVKIGSRGIAIEALKFSADRIALGGQFSYSSAGVGEPVRIAAELNASELDFDRAYALARAVFGESSFERPRAGTISAKLDRASIAGLEANDAELRLRFDGDQLEVEGLSIGDLAGAALSASGQIDPSGSIPRGTIDLDVDAHALDAVAAVLEKFAPSQAGDFRRRMALFVPAKVHATLSLPVDKAQPETAPVAAVLKVSGSAGTFRADLEAHAGLGNGAPLSIADLTRLIAGEAGVSGRINARDGSLLVELLGFDRWIAVDKRAAELSINSTGPFNGEMGVEATLTAGGLDSSARGTWQVAGDAGPAANLNVKIASARLRNLRPGSSSGTSPAKLSGRVALSQERAAVTDLAGNVGGADIAGQIEIGLTHPITVNGDVELGEIDLPAIIAAFTGVSPQGPAAARIWPAEPFEQGLLGQLTGQLKVSADHVSLTPMLAAKQVRGLAHFDESTLAFDGIDGSLAGGRLEGNLSLKRGSDGIITAHSRLNISGADLAEIIRGGPPPLSGRLGFEVDVKGSGRSPVAVIGSLAGAGRFKVLDGRIRQLDPTAFGEVIRGVDEGLPVDASRIRDRMEQALGKGGAAIPAAEGEIVIAAGQARLSKIVLQTEGATLGLAGKLALADNLLDAKLTLYGPERADAPNGVRPEVGIALKGPLPTPKRSVDTAEFANWLALRGIEQQAKRLDALESGRETPSETSSIAAPRPRKPVAPP